MFDTVVVAVAGNSTKSTLFSLDERVAMAEAVFADEPKVMVEPFSGLLMQYADKRGACALIRGLRATSDFEFEFQSALMNRHLNQDIETIFLMADYRWLYTSSTIVKTVASLGGDISKLVPAQVFAKLCERYGEPHYGHDDIMRQNPELETPVLTGKP
jgi:pantetheine-phosphate adenylyltransferase, bacterial